MSPIVTRLLRALRPIPHDFTVVQSWLDEILLVASQNRLPEVRIRIDPDTDRLIPEFYRHLPGVYDQVGRELVPRGERTQDRVHPLRTETVAFVKYIESMAGGHTMQMRRSGLSARLVCFTALADYDLFVTVNAYLFQNVATGLADLLLTYYRRAN